MRVIRHRVPVDGDTHVLALNGKIVHVAARQPDTVDVWTEDSGGPLIDRAFRVVGTGQALEGQLAHRGTAVTADGFLVWHVYEMPTP